MQWLNRTQQAKIATLILVASVFLSRFMGLIRDKIISWQFGASTESNLYFLAFIIPDFINYLLAGGYFSIILIPLLSRYFEKGKDEGYHFFNVIMMRVSITTTLFVLLTWSLIPVIIPYFIHNLSLHDMARLIYFVRIILPAQIFFIIGALFSSILYMRKQFLVPALMPLIYNLCIIIFGILFQQYGMVGYCYGVVIGAFLGAFLLPIYTVVTTEFVFHLKIFHKGTRTFFLLALPLMVGQSITVVEEQLVRYFASFASGGAVSLISYARRIMLLPIGFVAQAAGAASYPFLASLLVQKRYEEFTKTLHTTLYSTVAFILPITAIMFILAEQIIALLFYGGKFSKELVVQATPLLQYLLLGVPAWGIQQILVRAFYAHHNTVLPTIIGTAIALLSIPCYLYGVRTFNATGISAVSSIIISCYTIILCIAWRIRYNKDALCGLCISLVTGMAELIPAVTTAYFCLHYIQNILILPSFFTTSLLHICIVSSVFSITYIVTIKIVSRKKYTLFLQFFFGK